MPEDGPEDDGPDAEDKELEMQREYDMMMAEQEQQRRLEEEAAKKEQATGTHPSLADSQMEEDDDPNPRQPGLANEEPNGAQMPYREPEYEMPDPDDMPPPEEVPPPLREPPQQEVPPPLREPPQQAPGMASPDHEAPPKLPPKMHPPPAKVPPP